jgi:hypothetical protein
MKIYNISYRWLGRIGITDSVQNHPKLTALAMKSKRFVVDSSFFISGDFGGIILGYLAYAASANMSTSHRQPFNIAVSKTKFDA